MRATVVLPTVLRANAGGAKRLEVTLDGAATVGAVFDVLAKQHPALERRVRDEQRALRRYVNVYVDGEECRGLNGLDTPLEVEDVEIRIIPSVAGG